MRDCQVCGDYYPEEELTHETVDRSEEIGRPPGTALKHFYYCSKPECVSRASEFRVLGAHYAGADDPAMHVRSTDEV